jgi:hypothetical protein
MNIKEYNMQLEVAQSWTYYAIFRAQNPVIGMAGTLLGVSQSFFPGPRGYMKLSRNRNRQLHNQMII